MNPTVSVIINTLNRGNSLKKVLESLQWQKYEGTFEVIVVNGPSTDNTEEIIKIWTDRIRAAKCDTANLSASRNIGIRLAKGEIVVFIDDDAYPEPEWLTQMIAPFSDRSVGAVGGIVYDHTGFSFQYEYRTATRLLNCNWTTKNNAEQLCFPFSFEFPYPPGGNAAYRRTALIEVGGFDEEIEYYGDEVDLTVRLIDAGYLIKNIIGGYIHHKSAPSTIRNTEQIVKHWYPIIKNKIYFSLKNGRRHIPLQHIIQDNISFSRMWEQDVKNHIAAGLLTSDHLSAFEEQNLHAWETGVIKGLSPENKYITLANGESGNFLKFPTIGGNTYLGIVLVSQYFPPHKEGGIPTLTKELGEALARLGHIVHVVTQSPDINRVDLENGVWVHHVLTGEFERPKSDAMMNIPKRIWDWSATAFAEVKRISKRRPISVVEAPIWDCQGIAFIIDHQWPLITSLQTTLQFWLDSHPELKNDIRWMNIFGEPMLATEKKIMLQSDAVRSISSAIKHDIESAYGFIFEPSKIRIAHLGMSPEQTALHQYKEDNFVKVLFVGRLEYRKGIDVLLAAIPQVLERNPGIQFRIIGDDTLPKSGEVVTYKDEYIFSDFGQRWADRVHFEGRVDNDTLRVAYKNCDIFVAPSRFESFGLIFLEAMREGKPVIGCVAGGMPEVVSKDINGLLVEPGNVEELIKAILRLAESKQLRTTMGDAGRKIFLEKFTSERMAQATLELYNLAQKNFGETGN